MYTYRYMPRLLLIRIGHLKFPFADCGSFSKCFQTYDTSLINQAFSEPYWGRIMALSLGLSRP